MRWVRVRIWIMGTHQQVYLHTTWNTTNRRDIEAWAKGLTPMNQDNREEEVRLGSMDYEGHVKLWRVPYHSYEAMKSTISFIQNMTIEQRFWQGWLYLRWPLFIIRKMMEMEVGWYEVCGSGYVSNLLSGTMLPCWAKSQNKWQGDVG
jgi:hypothetical protein